MRLAVLISGQGSNLRALVRAWRGGDLAGAAIALVVSDRPAPGLKIAEEYSIPSWVLASQTRQERDAELTDVLDRHNIDRAILAGYMRVLGPDFFRQWHKPMVNIHPSLLPAFPGLNAPKQALEAGAAVSGCTVHEVTAEVDGGPIIAQAEVPILHDDTPETLHRRIQDKEHELYPIAVRQWLLGRKT